MFRSLPRTTWSILLAGSLFLAGLALGLVAPTLVGPAAHPDAAKLSHEVQTLLQEQVQAWNAGDLPRFLQTYLDDDQLTFFSAGTITRGYGSLAERYHQNYQAEGKEMGTLSFRDLEVLPLSSTTALARARWKLVTSKETIEGLFTLLVQRQPQGWKIVHDHTSRAEPSKS